MKFFLNIFIFFFTSLSFAQVIHFDNEQAVVKFVLPNDKVEGTVRGIKVDLKLNLKHIEKSQIVGRADATTLTTGIKLRDKHLQKPDYFNTEEFPFLTFTSTEFKKINTTEYLIKGKLKIKDEVKEVEWKFKEETFAWVGTSTIYTNDFKFNQKNKREKTEVQITIILPLK